MIDNIAQAIKAALVRGMAGLPVSWVSRIVGRRVRLDGQTLDLQAQLVLRLASWSGTPDNADLPVDAARRQTDLLAEGLGGPPRDMASVRNRTIPGPGGELPIRVYHPHSGATVLPALVYYHGGGWVVGSLRSHDRICRVLADEAGCIVVSVDYRLAPEHPFPAAVEDALAAFQWTVVQADELGIDAARVAVGGDSAGGNLSAVVCQLARSRPGPRPAYQLLIYPVTDCSEEAASYDAFAEGFYLTRKTMRWYKSHYLEHDADRKDPRASPLLARDVSGVAPALVVTVGFDPLRDEGIAYVDRLREAGVPAAHRHYESMIHGCINMLAAVEHGATVLAESAATLHRIFHGARQPLRHRQAG